MENIQFLENLEDLGTLIRGDAVQFLMNSSCVGFPDREEVAAFYRINDRGQYEFLVPAEMKEEYVIMHRAFLPYIEIMDGKVVFRENKSVTESYPQNDNNYDVYNETLVMAGLREIA